MPKYKYNIMNKNMHNNILCKFAKLGNSLLNIRHSYFYSKHEHTDFNSNLNEFDENAQLTDDCIVCMTQDKRKIYKTQCNHIFHRSCLSRWVHSTKYSTCPICRYIFSDREVANLEFSLNDQLLIAIKETMAEPEFKIITF